jgi:hypothetical protein
MMINLIIEFVKLKRIVAYKESKMMKLILNLILLYSKVNHSFGGKPKLKRT